MTIGLASRSFVPQTGGDSLLAGITYDIARKGGSEPPGPAPIRNMIVQLAGFSRPETAVMLAGGIAIAIALPLAVRTVENATEATAARAAVRAAIPLVEEYGAEHGSYEGFSTYPLKLRRSAPSRSLLMGFANSDSYCLMSRNGRHTAHIVGPAGAIQDGPCPPH